MFGFIRKWYARMPQMRVDVEELIRVYVFEYGVRHNWDDTEIQFGAFAATSAYLSGALKADPKSPGGLLRQAEEIAAKRVAEIRSPLKC